MKRITLVAAAIALIALAIWTFGGGGDTTAIDTPQGMIEDPLAPAAQLVPPQEGDTIATLETTFGIIKFKMFPEFTPETVKNFTELSNRGFYDGLTFHRIINDFMIQGGDPLGNGTGGESYKGPGTTIPDEISILRHTPYSVSMAKTNEPNSGSSQFFIVHQKGTEPQTEPGTHWLDGIHTVFGQVFEGMGVVDAIATTEVTKVGDRPIKPVTIIKATVETF
jgi:peptidyl-prolyl cis-trans isomerase B (cyclophilin B)